MPDDATHPPGTPATSTVASAALDLDWDALTDEATRLLSEFIRIDTSNPPGNEAAACDWLRGQLDAEGIPSRTCDAGEGRASLVATLAGDGSRGAALVLLNHTDVVPAQREHWRDDPFSGRVQDGTVWGRGASDMKGMAIVELMVLLLHRRLRLPLTRDLVFMAVADEESGGTHGIEFLDRAHPELLDCAFVLNEGGAGTAELMGVERPVFQVSVAEKGPLWLRLSATGTAGHGSVPHNDNAIDRLLRALANIAAWERPLVLTPPVAAYFDALYQRGVLTVEPAEDVRRALAAEVPRLHSLQTNSIAVTSVTAGVKHNVIPSRAEATLDVRLVPDYEPARFIKELHSTIDDPLIEVETVFSSSTPASPTQTELWRAIEAATAELVADAVVVPSVSTGFTNSRAFRRRGIPAYGLAPFLLSPDEAARAHGTDERLTIANLRLGMQLMLSIVRRVCG